MMALSRVRLFQPHGEGTQLLPQVITPLPRDPLPVPPMSPHPWVAACCLCAASLGASIGMGLGAP